MQVNVINVDLILVKCRVNENTKGLVKYLIMPIHCNGMLAGRCN